MPECVLCGRPAPLVVLCRDCLGLLCACGHPAGDHTAGLCLAFPACPCAVLVVVR